MSDNKPSVWETLSQIDVSKHVEKKNGFSYLSWAWAWQTLKTHYPEAMFEKHMNDVTNLPYFKDAETGDAFVIVTVMAGGTQATETYPVLDHKNQPIKNPNAFQVNASLQRCLAKAIAYLGLGAYIYAGEDLPFVPAEARVAEVNGEAKQGPKMIASALEAFLPTVETVPDLEGFWKNNKTAVDVLKDTDQKLYEDLLVKFKKRKKELENG